MSTIRASTGALSHPNASIHAINAELFRALGHPVRVRVLELLRAHEEMSVRELQTALQIESGGASQHLSVMRRQRLLTTRRQGTSVFYRVRDPRTFQLVEVARQVLTSQFEYTQSLLEGLNEAAPSAKDTSRAAKALNTANHHLLSCTSPRWSAPTRPAAGNMRIGQTPTEHRSRASRLRPEHPDT